jgi:hypothetical protein
MRVSTEEAARATAVANAISQEVVDRNAAITASASSTLASANQYTDGAIATEVLNRNSAIATSLSSANSYTDGAVNSLSTAVSQNIATLSSNVSTNLSNAISTEVVDRNGAIGSAVNNLSAAVSMALAEEASTARAAELSLETLLSSQIASTTTNFSNALSTETADRLAYEAAADVKFNSIQQAFDVIFDAIDIEKYNGSAPDYFQYNATVQDLSAPSPAPAPSPSPAPSPAPAPAPAPSQQLMGYLDGVGGSSTTISSGGTFTWLANAGNPTFDISAMDILQAGVFYKVRVENVGTNALVELTGSFQKNSSVNRSYYQYQLPNGSYALKYYVENDLSTVVYTFLFNVSYTP